MTLESLLFGSVNFYVDRNDSSTVLPLAKLLNDAATWALEISYIFLTATEAVPSDNCNLNSICFH